MGKSVSEFQIMGSARDAQKIRRLIAKLPIDLDAKKSLFPAVVVLLTWLRTHNWMESEYGGAAVSRKKLSDIQKRANQLRELLVTLDPQYSLAVMGAFDADEPEQQMSKLSHVSLVRELTELSENIAKFLSLLTAKSGPDADDDFKRVLRQLDRVVREVGLEVIPREKKKGVYDPHLGEAGGIFITSIVRLTNHRIQDTTLYGAVKTGRKMLQKDLDLASSEKNLVEISKTFSVGKITPTK